MIKLLKLAELELLIKKIDTDNIKKVMVFDIFEGQNIPEGKKSVAINVTIQAFDKTLTEKDLDQMSQKIIEIVKEKQAQQLDHNVRYRKNT